MKPNPPEPLPSMPEPAQPEPCAGDLVAAWCQGWSASHGGRQPDASLVRRVAGICKGIAKDRTDVDSWRTAWRAAQKAGGKGRWDIVSELAEPAPASSTNGAFDLLQQRQAESQAARALMRLLPGGRDDG